MGNKLILIKFLIQISEGVVDPSKQWKDGSIRRHLSIN